MAALAKDLKPAATLPGFLDRRRVWTFSARVTMVADTPDTSNLQTFTKNFAHRWNDPFLKGPCVLVKDVVTGRLVGLLIVPGPRGTEQSRRCVVLPPGPDTWLPKTGVTVECHGVALAPQEGESPWELTQEIIGENEALIATYNVAHLLGEQNQMVAENKKIGCLGTSDDVERFNKFHAIALLSLQADVIVMQEFAGVNKQGKDCTEDVCLAPIVEEMNKMLRDKMHGSTEDGNRLYEYSGISTSNDARYWHPYAIISRLPMSNFSQEEPVECQGMCGVTVSFPSGQHLRIYTSHLYYKPEERYQTDEINAHAMYMEGESRSTKMLDYKNILWGGDFNNRSLQCKAMKLIGRYGFKTTLPFHYVDTFFFRARHGVVEGSGGGDQGEEGSEILETKYYSPVGNFRTHKYFLYREDRLFGGGSHSDHLPVCTLVSLRKGV